MLKALAGALRVHPCLQPGLQMQFGLAQVHAAGHGLKLRRERGLLPGLPMHAGAGHVGAASGAPMSAACCSAPCWARSGAQAADAECKLRLKDKGTPGSIRKLVTGAFAANPATTARVPNGSLAPPPFLR